MSAHKIISIDTLSMLCQKTGKSKIFFRDFSAQILASRSGQLREMLILLFDFSENWRHNQQF